jgi:hypothetical protein
VQDVADEELLALVPAYKRGELSPAQAHRVAMKLRDDDAFRREAEREMLVVEQLAALSLPPLPKQLVQQSVVAAVGDDAAPDSWFSLDTFLIAIGIGALCALVAQMIAPRVPQWLMASDLVDSLSALAAGNAVVVIGVIWMSAMALLAIGGWLAIRAIRSQR